MRQQKLCGKPQGKPRRSTAWRVAPEPMYSLFAGHRRIVLLVQLVYRLMNKLQDNLYILWRGDLQIALPGNSFTVGSEDPPGTRLYEYIPATRH